MGLDMYLYEVNKLTNEEVKEIEGKCIDDLPCNIGWSLEEYMSEDLLPFSTLVDLKVQEYDFVKLKQDYSIDESATLKGVAMSNGNVTYMYSNNVINISEKELESKYLVTKIEKCYVYKTKEIQYWRKDYQLQEEIERRLSIYNQNFFFTLENCTMYLLPYEVRKDLEPYGCFCPQFKEENRNIFYYAWW